MTLSSSMSMLSPVVDTSWKVSVTVSPSATNVALLVAEPALLLTVTVYAPAFADCALATV